MRGLYSSQVAILTVDGMYVAACASATVARQHYEKVNRTTLDWSKSVPGVWDARDGDKAVQVCLENVLINRDVERS